MTKTQHEKAETAATAAAAAGAATMGGVHSGRHKPHGFDPSGAGVGRTQLLSLIEVASIHSGESNLHELVFVASKGAFGDHGRCSIK